MLTDMIFNLSEAAAKYVMITNDMVVGNGVSPAKHSSTLCFVTCITQT